MEIELLHLSIYTTHSEKIYKLQLILYIVVVIKVLHSSNESD